MQIELDGLKATEKEIDTVSVLQALKQAREELKSSSTSDDLQKVILFFIIIMCIFLLQSFAVCYDRKE